MKFWANPVFIADFALLSNTKDTSYVSPPAAPLILPPGLRTPQSPRPVIAVLRKDGDCHQTLSPPFLFISQTFQILL